MNYTRKCKQIARNPGSSRHCIRSNQPHLEREHSSAYKVRSNRSTGSEGQQCADGRIARNGQVQALGSKLAFPHFGNQFVTNLGEFFYLFILLLQCSF